MKDLALKAIYPSIYSADHMFLHDEVKQVDDAGFKVLHVDIQDGVFVPSISFGMKVVSGLRKYTEMAFDIHLMVVNPMSYIHMLRNVSNIASITFHPSSVQYPSQLISEIHRMGATAGFALMPMESLSELSYYRGQIENILMWTSEPDENGNIFAVNSLEKIKRVKSIFLDSVSISVDGNVNCSNLLSLRQAGADRFVMGREIFQADHLESRIQELNLLLNQEQ